MKDSHLFSQHQTLPRLFTLLFYFYPSILLSFYPETITALEILVMDPPFSPFPGLLSSISVPGLLPEDGKLESLPPTPITPAFAWPTTTSNKPKIILIFGGLGAGKSEACTKLTKELPVHVLSVDGLLKNFAKARPETLHDRFITDKMTSEKFSSRYKPLRAELIVDMLNDELKRIAKKDHKVIAHFILGFPRDEEQRELFIHKVSITRFFTLQQTD